MSEQVNKEQTKGAKPQKITELSDDQLDEAAGGGPVSGGELYTTAASALRSTFDCHVSYVEKKGKDTQGED